MREIRVIVEIPKGSRNKYEIHDGKLELDRVLPESMIWPANYGFIPRTLAKDGDELDAFVIMSEPLYPKTEVIVRPIGVIKMEDERGEDNKIICVCKSDTNYEDVDEITKLPSAQLNEITHFLKEYKTLEKNKFTKVGNVRDSTYANKLIEDAFKRQDI